MEVDVVRMGKMQTTKLMLIALAVVAVVGCAADRRRVSWRPIPDSHLIFNPERSTPAPPDNFRADWPVVLSGQPDGEEVEYRETIIDHQGRFGRNSDYHFRRFDSVRTGRVRR